MTAPNLLDELEGVVAKIRATTDPTAADDAATFIETHHATLADMAKRLEAAERDARRYRWLRPRLAGEELQSARAAMMAIGIAGPIGVRSPDYDYADELDAAIDAAQEGAG